MSGHSLHFLRDKHMRIKRGQLWDKMTTMSHRARNFNRRNHFYCFRVFVLHGSSSVVHKRAFSKVSHRLLCQLTKALNFSDFVSATGLQTSLNISNTSYKKPLDIGNSAPLSPEFVWENKKPALLAGFLAICFVIHIIVRVCYNEVKVCITFWRYTKAGGSLTEGKRRIGQTSENTQAEGPLFR